MPLIRLISVLGLSLAFGGLASAQSFSPSEAPPSGFAGREYVDSNGCVFLRSSFGGEVTWVPRYGADRQQICNATPSTLATQAPPSAPVSEQAAEMTRPAPEMRARPAEIARPTESARPSQTARATQRTMRRTPVLPENHHAACPSTSPFGQLVRMADGRVLVRCVDTRAALLPTGAQDATEASGRAASPMPGGAGHYVQVATFGVPANTSRTSARLQAQGLPVHVQHIRTRGRVLDLVLAGPFTDASSAHAALRAARGMGFGDAFFRN